MEAIYLRQLAVGPMRNFAYLVGGCASRDCVVIDPGWDARSLLEAAAQDGRVIRAVALTHGHEDHIGAVPYLWPRLRCPIYATPFTAAVLRRKLAEDLRKGG